MRCCRDQRGRFGGRNGLGQKSLHGDWRAIGLLDGGHPAGPTVCLWPARGKTLVWPARQSGFGVCDLFSSGQTGAAAAAGSVRSPSARVMGHAGRTAGQSRGTAAFCAGCARRRRPGQIGREPGVPHFKLDGPIQRAGGCAARDNVAGGNVGSSAAVGVIQYSGLHAARQYRRDIWTRYDQKNLLWLPHGLDMAGDFQRGCTEGRGFG